VNGVDRRLWRAWLAVGLVVVAGYFLLPPGRWYTDAYYDALGLGSAVAIVVGVRQHRPIRARVWYCFALGQGTWVAGDITFGVYRHVLHREPFPSLADGFYLAAYPIVVAALLMLIRGRTRGRDRAGWIDAAIIATGLGLLCWTLLMRPVMQEESLAFTTRLISVAYPAADVVLLAMLARLFISPGARTASYRLLTAAVVLLLISDLGFSLITTFSSYNGGVIDAGWLLSYVLWATAALHPSMRTLSQPMLDLAVAGLTRQRLALLASASLLAPALLLAQGWQNPAHMDWPAIGLGAMVLFLLVVARMSGLMAQIHHQAHRDELTRLGNRRLLHRHIETALSRHDPGTVHLLLFDLDDFKTINNHLGHRTGDELLVAVAERLSAVTEPGTVIARLDGEEFAILLAPASLARAEAEVHRIGEALRQPLCAGEHEVFLRATAGLSTGTGVTEPRELLRRADLALHSARDGGQQKVVRYTPAMDNHVSEEARLGARLRRAIGTDELYLVYQPIVELPEGHIVGAEALLRWVQPEGGVVPSTAFIPVAERNGLIVPLGDWILRTACLQAAQWARMPQPGSIGRVSVNVSVRQLCEPDFADRVAAILRETALDPARLAIEITETAVFGGRAALASVQSVRDLGVTIALDDFGTGQSSLSLLHTCPVDILKVDKSFIDELALDGQDVIPRALIQIADGLHLQAIAEGVETAIQASRLHRLGYRYAQGYHFGRPMSANMLTRILRDPAAVRSGGVLAATP
jgi:diguanylate cyclase (GGDEF)-like protein